MAKRPTVGIADDRTAVGGMLAPPCRGGSDSPTRIVLHAAAEKGTAQITDAVGYDPSPR